MSGYLRVKVRNAKWKQMWFVLKANVLYGYKAPEDLVPVETITLKAYDLVNLSEVSKLNIFCTESVLRNLHFSI